MSLPILTIALRTERDVVNARQRARELAAVLGFDNQDQIRLATATSEMARNAFRYATSGKVMLGADLDAQGLEVVVSDSGLGIPHLTEVLSGFYKSETGMGMGIVGTQRLMDSFQIETSEKGTTVRMQKHLPSTAGVLTARSVAEASKKMMQSPADDPYSEIERQNHELLNTLQELRARQEELMLLNRELEDTNRGVVALYAELDERADYLRRASELKTKFLSNVSHEFRTPLNSIISLARLLMERIDGDLSTEQEKQVRYIETSARDLQEMVNDLLDLAKVEAGKIKMRSKAFNVAELFSALKGMLKPLLADNNSVDLVFMDVADLPTLHTDEGKVSQILRNLISNALKFTPLGTVTVSAELSGTSSVLFKVVDTGIGIPPEHHETIFREFVQVENPLQERHRGTGLGLPLCRNLAMLLGGKLWFESEPGKGSTFYVEIPLEYVGESHECPEALPKPEFHRLPVLVLEDDSQTAEIVHSFFRHTEFQPIVTASIAAAESWLERHTPHAIVADIYIDGEPAWSLLEGIRAKFPEVELIATSAHNEGQRAIASGANTFLLKPLSKDDLLTELRRNLPQNGPKRLLLVDDNEVSRYILRELLDRPWLDIVEARNGREAMDIIAGAPPDAMILDLLMPDMSGMEVLGRIRNHDSWRSLPVIIYTSKPLTDDERQSIADLGAGVVKKEDVSARLSAKPFFDWLAGIGIAPVGEVA